jgi:hypothetical protein
MLGHSHVIFQQGTTYACFLLRLKQRQHKNPTHMSLPATWWLLSKVQGLTRGMDVWLGSRDLLLDALSPLGSLGDGIAGGEGAIYLWAKLPKGETSFGNRNDRNWIPNLENLVCGKLTSGPRLSLLASHGPMLLGLGQQRCQCCYVGHYRRISVVLWDFVLRGAAMHAAKFSWVHLCKSHASAADITFTLSLVWQTGYCNILLHPGVCPGPPRGIGAGSKSHSSQCLVVRCCMPG